MRNTVGNRRGRLPLFALTLVLAAPGGILAKPPDLTTVDLAALDTTRNYNLGPTGMRGWMLSDSLHESECPGPAASGMFVAHGTPGRATNPKTSAPSLKAWQETRGWLHPELLASLTGMTWAA